MLELEFIGKYIFSFIGRMKKKHREYTSAINMEDYKKHHVMDSHKWYSIRTRAYTTFEDNTINNSIETPYLGIIGQ